MQFFYKKSIEVSLSDLQKANDFIKEESKKNKVSKRELQTALLLFEESAVCLLQGKQEEKFNVIFEKKWGRDYLLISHKNNDEVNPLELIKEYNEEDVEESLRHTIFSSNQQILSFSHKEIPIQLVLKFMKQEILLFTLLLPQ